MGAPSPEQIDEAIAWGLANRWSEERILKHCATLERMTDEELAAIGVFPPAAKKNDLSPSLSHSAALPVSPSRGHAPKAAHRRKARRALVEGDKVEEVEGPPNPSSEGDGRLPAQELADIDDGRADRQCEEGDSDEGEADLPLA